MAKIPRTYWPFVCDFGNRHPISQKCNCERKYGMQAYKFREAVRERFRITYASEITESMRSAVLWTGWNYELLEKRNLA